MSDLSWLNPTPHAIAVYASQPPSPVLTQHSLPSGRYSLLGPDLHRLDRTSLRLAVAVGTLIAERPPHRSVLAAFPHTAPTSGSERRNAYRARDEGCVAWEATYQEAASS